MPEKACLECGATFTYKAAQPGRECCSMSCAARLRNRRLKAEGKLHRPIKPRRGATQPCLTCGTPVYREPRLVRQERPCFCSPGCFNAWQTKPPVIKSCPTCGREMRLKPSQAARQHCSEACETVQRIKRPLAEQHNGRPVKLDDQGYRMVWEPEHPNKAMKGWQYEHRLVTERMLGRYLGRGEHVHHINGDKADNRPENLQVMDGNEHVVLSGQEYRADLAARLARLAEYERRFGPLEPEGS